MFVRRRGAAAYGTRVVGVAQFDVEVPGHRLHAIGAEVRRRARDVARVRLLGRERAHGRRSAS